MIFFWALLSSSSCTAPLSSKTKLSFAHSQPGSEALECVLSSASNVLGAEGDGRSLIHGWGDSGLTDGVEYTVFQNRTELSTRFFEKPCTQEGLGDGENIKTMYFSILISKLQKYMVLKISMYKTLGLEAEVYDFHLVQKP